MEFSPTFPQKKQLATSRDLEERQERDFDRAIQSFTFRERRERIGVRPAGWFSFRNAVRLGNSLKRADLTEWNESGIAEHIGRAARKIGNWTLRGLRMLAGVVHQAWADSDGNDTLAVAMRRAAQTWAQFLPFVNGHERWAKLLCLAHHLRQMGKYEWNPFGSERIAKWLGVHFRTIDRDVAALENAGLIRVLRDEAGATIWSWRGKDSRMVRYAGPAIPEKGDDADDSAAEQGDPTGADNAGQRQSSNCDSDGAKLHGVVSQGPLEPVGEGRHRCEPVRGGQSDEPGG
jgi:hypothetical protein